MGPVRHRQLIRLLAFVVALDLAAGVVAVYAQGGSASAADQRARISRAGDTDGAPGGILASGQFTRRRGSGTKSTGAAPPGTAGTAAGPAGPAGTSTSRPTAPAPAPNTTVSSTGRATTTSTGRPSSSTGSPTTSSTNGRGTTSGPPPATTPPTAAPRTIATFTDPASDAISEDSGKPSPERRADIVNSAVNYGSSDLVFAVKTADPVDPAKDPHWASESTFVSWELDTNGDGTADYEVQFAFSEGTLVAGVSRPGDADGASVCEAEAGYTLERYAVGFDPECIGRPASFSYRVTTHYDTNPKDENSDVITDVAPDGGLSRPIPRPAG